MSRGQNHRLLHPHDGPGDRIASREERGLAVCRYFS